MGGVVGADIGAAGGGGRGKSKSVKRDSDYSELISAAGALRQRGDIDEGQIEGQGESGASNRPYTLEEQGAHSGNWVITFPAPASLIPMLSSRPVLCCGGAFDIRPGRGFEAIGQGQGGAAPPAGAKGAVCTSVISSDPDKIALEIHRRLVIRAESDGASVNACPMQ